MTAQGANTDRVRNDENDDDEARRKPWCFQAMVQDCRIVLVVVVVVVNIMMVSEDYLFFVLGNCFRGNCKGNKGTDANTNREEILFDGRRKMKSERWGVKDR